MKRLPHVILVVQITLLGFAPALGQDTQLADAPSCSPTQVNAWTAIKTKTLGIDGFDPVGAKVEHYGARKRILFKWGPNWMPMLNTKTTLCGTLERFGFYPGVGDIDREEDWNNFIIPDEDFKFLITEVQRRFPKAIKSVAKCNNGQVDCMEVEVTVHDNFFENRYFTRSTEQSMLIGEKICTYGPWIREKVHKDHPEIHPSELFWWTRPKPSGTAAPNEWWMMILQDNSNRYNSKDDFRSDDGDDPPDPPQWYPWASAQRAGRFRIAFEVKDGAAAETFSVKEEENHSVIPSNEDVGQRHNLRVGDRTILTVTEEQATEKIGVTFADVCRDTSGGRLIGFVELTGRVQTDQGDDGGYQVFRVEKTSGGNVRASPSTASVATAALAAQPSPTPLTATPQAPPRIEILPETLRRSDEGGRARIVADVRIEMPTAATDMTASKMIDSVQVTIGSKRRKLEYREQPEFVTAAGSTDRHLKFVLKDVPLTTGDPVAANMRFELKTKSISTTGPLSLQIPQPVLAPIVRRETARTLSSDSDALDALVSAAGGNAATSNQPAIGAPIKSSQVEVDVTPAYAAAAEDATISPEDLLPVSERFNEAIEATEKNDFSKLNRLFGTAQPFKMTTWKFSAKNLATGQTVPVREVAAAEVANFPNDVRIVKGSGTVANGNLLIVFPDEPKATVYEVSLEGKMEDPYTAGGTLEHRIWSHYLPIKKDPTAIDDLLKFVALRSGVSPEALSNAWQSPSTGPLEEPRIRNARIFRQLGLQSAEDGKITFEELQTLIQSAKLVVP